MATQVQEVLPPALNSTSDPPAIFDGTTKLYISYICPYAQRVWITRNVKVVSSSLYFQIFLGSFIDCVHIFDSCFLATGIAKIKLVPIDLQNRPAWYKEKVYPTNKVPSLEHNNEVKGESLDLIKYLDSEFDGPKLLPDDPAKKEFADELLAYTDKFNGGVISSFKGDVKDAEPVLDYIENALSKFEDGPFFLGQFSLVDIAYAPFIERFRPFLFEVKKYDIADGRPKLAAWIGEIDKIEAYKVTKVDPKEVVEAYKKRFLS